MFAFSSCHSLFTSLFDFLAYFLFSRAILRHVPCLVVPYLHFLIGLLPRRASSVFAWSEPAAFLSCHASHSFFCFGGGSLSLQKKRAGGLRDFYSPRLPPALVKTQTPSGFSFLCGVTPLFQLCFLFVLKNCSVKMSSI